MINFKQKDANNMAKLLLEIVPSVSDEANQKLMLEKSKQLKDISRGKININKDILEDMAYNTEHLLLFSLKLQNHQYIKSVTNLLKDFKNNDSFDIDKNFSVDDNSKGAKFLSTEVMIAKIMNEYVKAKQSDKEVYYECIKGILGVSGRNKDKNPLEFAREIDNFDFLKDYKASITLSELKETIKGPKINEEQLNKPQNEFMKGQKADKASYISSSSGLKPQNPYKVSIHLMGVAILTTLYLLKRQYHRITSFKNGQNENVNVIDENMSVSKVSKKKKKRNKNAAESRRVVTTEQELLKSTEGSSKKDIIIDIFKSSEKTEKINNDFVEKLVLNDSKKDKSFDKAMDETVDAKSREVKNSQNITNKSDEMVDAKTKEIKLLKYLLRQSEEQAIKAREETRTVRSFYVNRINKLNQYVKIVERNANAFATQKVRKSIEPEKEIAYKRGIEVGAKVAQNNYIGLLKGAYDDGVATGFEMAKDNNLQAIQKAYYDGYGIASAEVHEASYKKGYNEGYFYAVQRYPKDSTEVLKKQLNIKSKTDRKYSEDSKENNTIEPLPAKLFSIAKDGKLSRSYSI